MERLRNHLCSVNRLSVTVTREEHTMHVPGCRSAKAAKSETRQLARRVASRRETGRAVSAQHCSSQAAVRARASVRSRGPRGDVIDAYRRHAPQNSAVAASRAPDIKVASVTSRGGDDVTVTSPPPPPPAVYDVAFTSAAEKTTTTTTTTFAYSATRCLRTVARPSCDISSSGSSYLHVAFTTVHRPCNCRSSVVRTPRRTCDIQNAAARLFRTFYGTLRYIFSSSELCSTICCLYVVLLRRNKR